LDPRQSSPPQPMTISCKINNFCDRGAYMANISIR
jgi:hypothetical protein